MVGVGIDANKHLGQCRAFTMPVFTAAWWGYGKKLLSVTLKSRRFRFHKEGDNVGWLQIRIVEGVRKCGRRMSGSSSSQSQQFWMSPSGLLLAVLTGSAFSIPGELTGTTAAEAIPEAKHLSVLTHNVHEWPSTCKTGFGCVFTCCSADPRDHREKPFLPLPPHFLPARCLCLPLPSELLFKLFSLNILEVWFQDKEENKYVLVVGRKKSVEACCIPATQNRRSSGLI